MSDDMNTYLTRMELGDLDLAVPAELVELGRRLSRALDCAWDRGVWSPELEVARRIAQRLLEDAP